MVHRWLYHKRGGHVHVRVFCSATATRQIGTLGKCGDLVYREEEFTEVKRLLQLADVQFIDEGAKT